MRISIQISLTVLLSFKIVSCLESQEEIISQNTDEGIPVSQVVDMILSKGRRAISSQHAARAKSLRQGNAHHHNHHKAALRQGDRIIDPSDMMDAQAKLIESELKNALAHKKSALFDKPFVEKQGRNDFLVIQPDHKDPFVTVIPNAIYYNIEKRCVNWLDDCNLQGIRARLLRGVQSPYKK